MYRSLHRKSRVIYSYPSLPPLSLLNPFDTLALSPQLRASLGLLASITQPVSTNYDYWTAGSGGHVHIIDTGVNRCHPIFGTAAYTGYADCVKSDETLNAESIPQSRVHFPWYVGG